jgi:hypothetical protein
MKKVYQNKKDRLLHDKQPVHHVAVDSALAPVDRLMYDMERKWGQDRLISLVSPETASKFGSAWAKMEDAISDYIPAEVIKRAGAVLRGLQVMDAEAEAAGAELAYGGVFVSQMSDGTPFGILVDGYDWRVARESYPDLQLFSLHEVGVALQHMQDWPGVREVKEAFPGAEVKKARLPKTYNDEVPF